MLRHTPFLVQVAEAPRHISVEPALLVGSDGLLRREGSQSPFVDELSRSFKSHDQNSLYTIVTKAHEDSPDPDMGRTNWFDDGMSAFGLSTIITRTPEPNDPDSFRTAGYYSLVTSYTGGRRDKPDPDWFRRD